MFQPRCGHPDYGPDVEAATGSGSWPNCHGIGDFHCAKVRVNPEGMPTFLKPVFDQVLNRVRAAYRDMGLSYDWVGEESTFHNTSINFVPRSNGWIGLAIVGQRESCSSKIWARFLATYKPNNVLNEWTTLIMHELGHNAGLHHSRGGVMNPSIVQGLAPTWRGDPSESILANYYGGEPIPGDNTPPTGKEFWTHQGLKSNKGQILWIPLSAPFPVGEEQ